MWDSSRMASSSFIHRFVRAFACLASLVMVVLGGTGSAHAFSTRVHIAIANDVRDALIAGGGKTIALKLGDGVVKLRDEDARAIVSFPLAFRAGSIGPDNMIFPEITDPSHAIYQRPFEQCDLLYRAAVADEERAYALGCFLHGSTDAVAHHYVNYLSGETFTLTPLASAREQDFSNVIRHIAAEAMIEDALLASDPDVFQNGALTHAIPIPFVQRAYFDRKASPLYQMLAKRSSERYARARTTKPDGRLQDVLAISGLEPADHLVLAPLYLEWIDESLSALQTRFASMKNRATPVGAQLQVGAGPDGKLGTRDDTTACTTSCAQLFAEYSLYTHLMAPRFDASGRVMESAYDKVMRKLHDDLASFVPTYLQTVDNVSTKLNTPYTKGQKKMDVDALAVVDTFAPITEWANRVSTLDYDAIAKTVIPDVWLDFFAYLRRFGISISPPDIMRLVMGPIIGQIEEVAKDYIVAQGNEYFRSFSAAYKAKYEGAKSEYARRLREAAPEGGPTILDDLRSSGLYGHAFNVTAAALADRRAVLPTPSDDPIGLGAASFDTSYSTHWMQIGLCEPLRAKVLPLGLGIQGILSLKKDGKVLEARVSDEATVECHDGSLKSFASAPSRETCKVVELSALVADRNHRGSVTRGYPPELAARAATCATNGSTDWLTTTTEGSESEEDMRLRRTTETSGCGCKTTGASSTSAGSALAGLLGISLLALRRRAARAVSAGATTALAIGVSACTETVTSVDEEIIPGERRETPGSTTTTTTPGEREAPAEPLPEGLSPAAKALLTKLAQTTWHGTAVRNGKSRAIEISFRASRLQWGEVQNPFGPARKRELRAFTVDDAASVHTIVTNPNTWLDGTNNHDEGDYKLDVVEGKPRKLKVTLKSTGKVEEYLEGPTPAPTSGVTAIVRTFASAGTIDNAFCRASYFSAVDYVTMFNFARYGRAKSVEPELGMDFVVGANISQWSDTSGQNRFSPRDLAGFDRNGGTELTDQQNFFVYYTGSLVHPGGTFSMRELDDAVADGIWSFLGPQVGSNLAADFFLEVHSRPWWDTTYDVGTRTMAKANVPVEVVVARCASTIKTVTVQGRLDAGPWKNIDQFPTVPVLDPRLLTQPL